MEGMVDKMESITSRGESYLKVSSKQEEAYHIALHTSVTKGDGILENGGVDLIMKRLQILGWDHGHIDMDQVVEGDPHTIIHYSGFEAGLVVVKIGDIGHHKVAREVGGEPGHQIAVHAAFCNLLS